MPTNPITPSQLADGARLLEEFKENPNPRTYAAWSQWRADHGEALLLRLAEVEGCVREIVEVVDAAIDDQPNESRAVGLIYAKHLARDLASRHNIDLSEPTTNTTGESP